MNIWVEINPNSLIDGWSSEDEGSIDFSASEQRYLDQVHAAIKAAYPRAAISVRATTAHSRVEIDGASRAASRYDIRGNVDNIISTVYGAMNWCVDAGTAAN